MLLAIDHLDTFATLVLCLCRHVAHQAAVERQDGGQHQAVGSWGPQAKLNVKLSSPTLLQEHKQLGVAVCVVP